MAGLRESQQCEIAQECVKQGWSARKIEEEIRKLEKYTTSRSTSKDPNIARLERIILNSAV